MYLLLDVWVKYVCWKYGGFNIKDVLTSWRTAFLVAAVRQSLAKNLGCYIFLLSSRTFLAGHEVVNPGLDRVNEYV